MTIFSHRNKSIENRGQLDSRVAFYANGAGKTLYFTSEGITFALIDRVKEQEKQAEFQPALFNPNDKRREEQSIEFRRHIVKLDFIGANPCVTPIPQSPTPAVISYFKGSPEQWKTGLKTYGMLVYPDLWPGIDLIVNGETNQLKYSFVVKPGADPSKIKLAYRGATSVKINNEGQLKIATPLGSLSDDKPVSYQEVDGRRVEIASDSVDPKLQGRSVTIVQAQAP